MIPTPGHLSERKKHLSEQIGRERTDLAVAYRGLIKPFQYTETGIAGLKVLRKNGWMIALAPAVVRLGFSFFGWEKKGKPTLLGRLRRQAARPPEDLEEEAVARVKKPLARWGKRAWSLFQVYRKVRPFFP